LEEPSDGGKDEEGEAEQFFDTHRSGSPSSEGAERRRGKSIEIDTEEDPVAPITPGSGAQTFSIDVSESANGKTEVAVKSAKKREEFDDDMDDDWVDSSMSSPHRSLQPSLPPQKTVSVEAPPLGKGKLNGGKKGKRGKKGKEVVTIKSPNMRPGVDQGQQSPPQQQHYPFPVSQRSTDEGLLPLQEENMRNLPGVVKGKRMHTTRARDGGRTQSGGVKGVLPIDD
jgi:cysteine protease ATG4